MLFVNNSFLKHEVIEDNTTNNNTTYVGMLRLLRQWWSRLIIHCVESGCFFICWNYKKGARPFLLTCIQFRLPPSGLLRFASDRTAHAHKREPSVNLFSRSEYLAVFELERTRAVKLNIYMSSVRTETPKINIYLFILSMDGLHAARLIIQWAFRSFTFCFLF